MKNMNKFLKITSIFIAIFIALSSCNNDEPNINDNDKPTETDNSTETDKPTEIDN